MASILDSMDSFDAYFPLTPGQSPDGVTIETSSEEFHNLKSSSGEFHSLTPLPQANASELNITNNGDIYNHVVRVTTPESTLFDVGDVTEQLTTLSQGCVVGTETMENAANDERKVKKRRARNKEGNSELAGKATTRALQYPPCCVCGGKASGDHYGVNSCEPCKGFFRRYLLREKGAFLCKKGGNCEVTHTIKGMCSGCRLKKCLELGMSKEKCKLGRYSSEKRTEKIKTVLQMNGTQAGLPLNGSVSEPEDRFISLDSPSQETARQDEIITRTLSQLRLSDHRQNSFCDALVADLIEAKKNLKPFDANKSLTDEEIQTRIKEYYDHYMLKVKMYGEMKPVPKEEFTQLYGEFGIDVDGRMKELKYASENIERDVNDYCSFAKRIPYFSKLSFKDQSNLLKVGRMDFFTILLSQGYDPERQVLLYKFRAYHADEMAIFFSKELIQDTLSQYKKCQKLCLNEAEKSLLLAQCLFFTDRCSLENPSLVEKIQLSLTQMLQRELERTCPATALSRFSKIIDYLTSLREVSDQYYREYEDLCRDELYVNECPLMTDFLLDA